MGAPGTFFVENKNIFWGNGQGAAGEMDKTGYTLKNKVSKPYKQKIHSFFSASQTVRVIPIFLSP
jgi:hypothetical protein